MDKKDDSESLNDCKSSCQPVQVPTEDECMALDALRAIKDNVRALKKKLSGISSRGEDKDTGERMALEKELAQLKTEWNEWEEKRRKAATERMILLGHEEVSQG